MEAPPPLTEAADFHSRAAAYRNSYFRSYRQATLLIGGFTPDLRGALMWDQWNDVANRAGPPKSKYKNFRQVVPPLVLGACPSERVTGIGLFLLPISALPSR